MRKMEIIFEKCEEDPCYRCSVEPECGKLNYPLCDILRRCAKIGITDNEFILEAKEVEV